MGFMYEFNGILKLSEANENNLCVGQNYTFGKSGVRVFPIDMSIDLVNRNWEVIAQCVIKQITITSKETTGEYSIIEIYDLEKREMLTEQWRSLLKRTKNISDVVDYSEMHITLEIINRSAVSAVSADKSPAPESEHGAEAGKDGVA
jgi:hypothetical protein